MSYNHFELKYPYQSRLTSSHRFDVFRFVEEHSYSAVFGSKNTDWDTWFNNGLVIGFNSSEKLVWFELVKDQFKVVINHYENL